MGKTALPQKVKFFCGVIYNARFDVVSLRRTIEERWGRIDIASSPIPFIYTDYYTAEMGAPLLRELWSFDALIDRDILIERKTESNAIEESYLIAGNRPVNLDPGYFTLGQFILASTKDRDQRIYLGQGIYAEVTLRYSKNKFHTYPWSYRDYASPEYEPFLLQMRNRLYEQVQETKL